MPSSTASAPAPPPKPTPPRRLHRRSIVIDAGQNRRVGKGALAPCPPCIYGSLEWWARCALPTLRVYDSYHIPLSNSLETCVRIPAARSARVLRPFRPRSMSRGRREDRVRAAPAVSCAEMVEYAHEHTGSAEEIRPSLRDGLQLIRALPGERLSCHRRPRKSASRELDTSAAVPEPHAFAVRLARARLSRAPASTASHRNVRDDRDPPLIRMRRGELVRVICPT